MRPCPGEDEHNEPHPSIPDSASLHDIQQRLLEWFAAAARDLPWRQTRNPYHILVAEVMLQQTQVDRVIPRYTAFLAAFPTLEHLAAAPTAEVIRQWAGLGYNRRAVNLQRIAQTICNQHNGIFPQQPADLQRLPGIGPYTAGAIACFAFEQDVAFMDTNIRRVVRRLLVGAEESPPAMSERALLELARLLIPAGQGWRWNQALMELGALICTSASPLCWRCPLRPHCRAYAAWRIADETVFLAPAADEQTDQQRPYAMPGRRRATRRVAERGAQPFIGSTRYYRGRLIARLRTLPAGERIALDRLGPLIKDGFQPETDGDWLRELAAGLARDGLLEIDADEVGLPET